MNRRQFISKAAAGSAALASLPHVTTGAPIRASKDPLKVACVGIGHMGNFAVTEGMSENLVALCDVDWRSEGKGWDESSPARIAAAHAGVRRFTDFRRMLDKMHKDIDAVLISTPDHTHFPVAMAAMELGKHVFVQKPLAHNIWQLRTLQKAAHHYGVKTNMGNQGHTFEGARLIKEWYQNEILGEVREVHCWTDRPRAPWFIKPSQIPPPPERVPKSVAWDLWQGPVPSTSFSSEYVPTKWRAWWNYGTGCLGDIGCHSMDAPFWALDLGLPTSVDVILDEPANRLFTPFGARVIYQFPARGAQPPVTLYWYEGGRSFPPTLDGMEKLPAEGMYMVGSKETVFHEGIRPESAQLWPRERMHDYKDILKKRNLPRVEGGPIQELFRDIKGEGPQAGSNFDYSARLTEVILLGALAIRLGHRLEWDSESMQITNVPGLGDFIKEPVRRGWSFGEKLWTWTQPSVK